MTADEVLGAIRNGTAKVPLSETLLVVQAVTMAAELLGYDDVRGDLQDTIAFIRDKYDAENKL